jgi:DNA anti-recombination protein RmuC
LFKKIDDVNQKISQIKLISQNEKEIMDKQIYFEEKINEKDLECKKILEDNNKLNLEYNLLNDKYVRLKEKNNEEEKELNILKQVQEEKINEIEKKLCLLMEEMNQLKNENIELKKI